MLMQIISKHSAEISWMQYIKLQIAMKYVSFLKVISLEIAENIKFSLKIFTTWILDKNAEICTRKKTQLLPIFILS